MSEPCPIRSSITDQPCLEPAGHPQWSEYRFHHYERVLSLSDLPQDERDVFVRRNPDYQGEPIVEREGRRRHDPTDHDCRGGARGDRFPF